MNLLQKKIAEASQKYYTDGTSDVTDREFDQMLEELREQDPNNELLTAVGHGYKVDADSTQGEKIPHRYGNAGSLEKCHNWKELRSDLKEYNGLWASLKLDGMSVVLYYENGDLVRALTRGSGQGEIGIDITEKVRTILDFTPLYDEYFTGAVRGEIIMSYKNFEQFLEIHPEAKNPRNSTVGLINGDITPDYSFLDIVVYSVVGRTVPEAELDRSQGISYTDMIYWLNTNFMRCAPVQKVYLTEENMLDVMGKLQTQWYGEYPADGIVLNADDLSLVSKEGDDIEVIYQGIAFKFKAESATTKVIGVEWNLSKTKYLVPRIQFETVQLSGTSVSWCAGNNAQYIIENGIGVGAEIEVLKSGEIIPYLEKVHTPVTPDIPTHCPACGAELVRQGVHLVCPNVECADADIQDALIWMQNIAPYDGLGDVLKLKFLSDMFGDNISVDTIYEAGQKAFPPTQYVKLSDFQKMYNQLFTNKVSLVDAIKALNIPRFGDVTSGKLAEYPEYVKYLIECATNGTEEIADMSLELGQANFNSLAENIRKFKRLNYIRDNIAFEAPVSPEAKGKVAITGKLSVKRNVFEAELRAAGYSVGDISKDTNFLITDDPTSSSSKNKKAEQWGITKITEADFRNAYINR